ncbi:MAG: hypothetical protein H0X35_08650 [Pseudonocardiales bacterium]|nr:hypothetical protein [Pseudonocardiales bacterium]
MRAEEFSALFDAASHSVFRLETLQTYAVPADDASLTAFRTGTPRPERSVSTSPWLRRVAATTIAGVAWSRVRVVEHPLTEYTRWELLAYVESQAVGEQVHMVARSDVGDLGPDFWLLDAGTPMARAVLMHYTPDGELVNRELVTDVDTVADLAARRDVALTAEAISLNAFLAHLAGRGDA